MTCTNAETTTRSVLSHLSLSWSMCVSVWKLDVSLFSGLPLDVSDQSTAPIILESNIISWQTGGLIFNFDSAKKVTSRRIIIYAITDKSYSLGMGTWNEMNPKANWWFSKLWVLSRADIKIIIFKQTQTVVVVESIDHLQHASRITRCTGSGGEGGGGGGRRRGGGVSAIDFVFSIRLYLIIIIVNTYSA